MRSLFGAIALCLWFYAIGKLPLATAMTLNYTAPVWMVFFVVGGILLRGYRQISFQLLLTVALGFGAIILILQPDIQKSLWMESVIGLLSGIMSAIAFLQVAALGKAGEPEYRVVFYFSLVGMILGAAITILYSGGFTLHTWHSALMLLALGMVAAGAQWSLTYAFSKGNTLVNASLQYLTIAFSSGLGILVFDDHITLMTVTGMSLVVASGVMAAYVQDDEKHR